MKKSLFLQLKEKLVLEVISIINLRENGHDVDIPSYALVDCSTKYEKQIVNKLLKEVEEIGYGEVEFFDGLNITTSLKLEYLRNRLSTLSK